MNILKFIRTYIIEILLFIIMIPILNTIISQLSIPFQVVKHTIDVKPNILLLRCPADISLDLSYLPVYMGYTLLRIIISLVFSCILSLWLGKVMYEHKVFAQNIMFPAINILQSIPTIGFLTLSTTTLIKLFPNSTLGAHLAIIFALVSSQVWNMIISVERSLNSMQHNYKDIQKVYGLSQWTMFSKIELPVVAYGLVHNVIISMSASWFMIVAAESLVLALNNNTYDIDMPGIGAFINKANTIGNYGAIMAALFAMLLSILACYYMLFRPLLFHFDRTKIDADDKPFILKLLMRLQIKGWLSRFYILQIIGKIMQTLFNVGAFLNRGILTLIYGFKNLNHIFKKAILLISGYSLLAYLYRFLLVLNYKDIINIDIIYIIALGYITMMRIFFVLFIATIIMVPLGIMINRKPKLIKIFQPLVQIIMSFPINIFYVFFANCVIVYNLNFNFFCIFLILISSMWYILSDVISSDPLISEEINDSVILMKLKGWALWTKVLIPSVFPRYVLGVITASGAAWNSSVLCEYIEWGKKDIMADGIGSYISINSGKFIEVASGIIIMSLIIFIINKFVFQALLDYSDRRFLKKAELV